jgi:hypothetical protein
MILHKLFEKNFPARLFDFDTILQLNPLVTPTLTTTPNSNAFMFLDDKAKEPDFAQNKIIMSALQLSVAA